VVFVATAMLTVISVGLEAQTKSGANEEVFSASDDFEPIEGSAPENGSIKPAIQNIATNDLTLVAVIVPDDKKDVKSRLAMVDFNGHDYEIKEGSKIGNQNGYVKEIAETYVIIEEESLNNLGEKISKEILLTLSE
jgi:Tfp pilus assembly protein PilP